MSKMKKKIQFILAFVVPSLAIIVILLLIFLSSCDRKTTDKTNSKTQPTTQAATTVNTNTSAEPSAQYGDGSTTDTFVSSTEYGTLSTEPGNNQPTDTSGSGAPVSPTTAPNSPSPTSAPNVKPTTAPAAPNPTTTPAPAPKPTAAPTVKPTESSTADPHAGKTYHDAVYKIVHHEAVYEDVWVIDQEAYTYDEPIYEKRVYTICHVCGAEFDTTYDSSEFFAHGDYHMLYDGKTIKYK